MDSKYTMDEIYHMEYWKLIEVIEREHKFQEDLANKRKADNSGR